MSAPDSIEGEAKEEGLVFCGLPDSGGSGPQEGRPPLALARISFQWEGLRASETPDGAMLETPTMLRADGQNMG